MKKSHAPLLRAKGCAAGGNDASFNLTEESDWKIGAGAKRITKQEAGVLVMDPPRRTNNSRPAKMEFFLPNPGSHLLFPVSPPLRGRKTNGHTGD